VVGGLTTGFVPRGRRLTPASRPHAHSVLADNEVLWSTGRRVGVAQPLFDQEFDAVEFDGEDVEPAIDAVDDRGVSADLVRAYLNGIGRTKLLTAEQEVDLARRIEAGLFAEERLGEEGLDAPLRADLTTIMIEGRAAKSHLLEANLRLVV